MEPFFSVLLSSLFLNQPSSPAVLLTLLPIVGGVAMASVSEVGPCSNNLIPINALSRDLLVPARFRPSRVRVKAGVRV